MSATSNYNINNLNLKPFDKSLFYKIYLPDLFADILLIVFAFFVSDELFSDKGIFFQIKGWQLLGLYSIVTLTIPWYLGYIYAKNKPYFSPIILKIMMWVFIVLMLMILVNLVRLVYLLDLIGPDFSKGIDGFMAAFAMFLLVLGPMMCISGAVSAQEEFNEYYNPKVKDKGVTAAAFIIMILAVAIMLYIFGIFPKEWGGLAAVVGMFGGPLGAIIIYGLFLALMNLLKKLGIYKYLQLIAQNTFPFFIIAVLVFWSGVAIYFMELDFGNSAGKISLGGMIFSVIISGLIPFRIVMMFNAPFRLINIVIGILSLSFFLFQLFSLIK